MLVLRQQGQAPFQWACWLARRCSVAFTQQLQQPACSPYSSLPHPSSPPLIFPVPTPARNLSDAAATALQHEPKQNHHAAAPGNSPQNGSSPGTRQAEASKRENLQEWVHTAKRSSKHQLWYQKEQQYMQQQEAKQVRQLQLPQMQQMEHPQQQQTQMQQVEHPQQQQQQMQQVEHPQQQQQQVQHPQQQQQQVQQPGLPEIKSCSDLEGLSALLRGKRAPPMQAHILHAVARAVPELASRGKAIKQKDVAEFLSALTAYVKQATPHGDIPIEAAEQLLNAAQSLQPSRHDFQLFVEAVLQNLAKDNFKAIRGTPPKSPEDFNNFSQLVSWLVRASPQFTTSRTQSGLESKPGGDPQSEADAPTVLSPQARLHPNGSFNPTPSTHLLVGAVFKEIVRTMVASAAVHGRSVNHSYMMLSLMGAPQSWMEPRERKQLAVSLALISMNQLPALDTFSLMMIMRSMAVLDLFEYNAWKVKRPTADASLRLQQLGLPTLAKQPSSVGYSFLTSMLAAFHIRRDQLNAKELATVIWCLGSAAKLDSTLAAMLAFQSDGHAAVLTEAINAQTKAGLVLSHALKTLKKHGVGLPIRHSMADYSSIDVLQRVCPPGTWDWSPHAPSGTPAVDPSLRSSGVEFHQAAQVNQQQQQQQQQSDVVTSGALQQQSDSTTHDAVQKQSDSAAYDALQQQQQPLQAPQDEVQQQQQQHQCSVAALDSLERGSGRASDQEPQDSLQQVAMHNVCQQQLQPNTRQDEQHQPQQPTYNFIRVIGDLTDAMAQRVLGTSSKDRQLVCHSISIILWSLSYLRFYSKPLLDAIYKVTSPEYLCGASSITLSQLAFSVVQLDGNSEPCKNVIRMCADEFIRKNVLLPENQQAFTNICWAHVVADDPGTPDFQAAVLHVLQSISLDEWSQALRRNQGKTRIVMHQLYSYLLVLQELEWEHAARLQLQQQHQGQQQGHPGSGGDLHHTSSTSASGTHLQQEALYLPRSPFQLRTQGPQTKQVRGDEMLSPQMSSSSSSSSSSIGSRSKRKSSSSDSSSSAFMPWHEPWLQDLMALFASVCNYHYTKSSGFEKAVRASLKSLCTMEGSTWKMVSGDFTPDGHVSLDMGLETTCGSVRTNLEADGPWHFMVNDCSRSMGSSLRRMRASRRRGILEVSASSEVWDQFMYAQAAEKVSYLNQLLCTRVSDEVAKLNGKQPDGWAPGTLERVLNSPVPTNEHIQVSKAAWFTPTKADYARRVRKHMIAALDHLAHHLQQFKTTLVVPVPLRDTFGSTTRVQSMWQLPRLYQEVVALSAALQNELFRQEMQQKRGVTPPPGSQWELWLKLQQQKQQQQQQSNEGGQESRPPKHTDLCFEPLDRELFYRLKDVHYALNHLAERIRSERFTLSQESGVKQRAAEGLMSSVHFMNQATQKLQSLEHRIFAFAKAA